MSITSNTKIRPLRFPRYGEYNRLVIMDNNDSRTSLPVARGHATYVTANEYWTIYKDEEEGWVIVIQESPNEESQRLHTICQEVGVYQTSFRTRNEAIRVLEEIVQSAEVSG